ncbi:hypothetical protein QUF90_05715, partial [Desulfococcaceae bacterium HSG9]|nr:hypothetical protein [Desulfococcaceae bacterium HSG9]
FPDKNLNGHNASAGYVRVVPGNYLKIPIILSTCRYPHEKNRFNRFKYAAIPPFLPHHNIDCSF